MRSTNTRTLLAAAIISTGCAALVTAGWDAVRPPPATASSTSATDLDNRASTAGNDLYAALAKMEARLDELEASDRHSSRNTAHGDGRAGTHPAADGAATVGAPGARADVDMDALAAAVAELVDQRVTDQARQAREAQVATLRAPYNALFAIMAEAMSDDWEFAQVRARLEERLQDLLNGDKPFDYLELRESLGDQMRHRAQALFERYRAETGVAARWQWDNDTPTVVAQTRGAEMQLGVAVRGEVAEGDENVHLIDLPDSGWYEVSLAVESEGDARLKLYERLDRPRRSVVAGLGWNRSFIHHCDDGLHSVTVTHQWGPSPVRYAARVESAQPIWIQPGTPIQIEFDTRDEMLLAIEVSEPTAFMVSFTCAPASWSFIEITQGYNYVYDHDADGPWAVNVALAAGVHHLIVEAGTEDETVPMELLLTTND